MEEKSLRKRYCPLKGCANFPGTTDRNVLFFRFIHIKYKIISSRKLKFFHKIRTDYHQKATAVVMNLSLVLQRILRLPM